MSAELLTVEQAALAWAQGKTVEIQLVTGKWVEIPRVGCDAVQKSGWLLGANVFNASHCPGPFRLAPEPPAKKLRPYTREELVQQIGRRIQTKTGLTIGMLSGIDSSGCGLVCLAWLAPDALLENWEWVGGEPCGVEVDA